MSSENVETNGNSSKSQSANNRQSTKHRHKWFYFLVQGRFLRICSKCGAKRI